MNPSDTAATVGRLPILVFMAWRNIWRNPVRSALTIAALAGSLVLVILYAALLEGMMRQMVEHATDLSVGHLQVHRQAFVEDQDLYATLPWPYLDRLEKELPGVHIAPRLYAAGLASSAETSTGVMIKAVDPEREPRVTRLLGAVRSGEAKLGVADDGAAAAPATGAAGVSAPAPTRYNVLIGAQLARNTKLAPGDELVLVTQAADGSIGNALYRIAGVLKPIDPGFDRTGVLMAIEAFQQLMVLHDGFHELAVRLDDVARLDEVQGALGDRIASLAAEQPLDRLGGGAIVRNWRQLAPAVADMLQLSRSIVLIVGVVVVALAAMGMLNTMLMAVHERTREFGILLAIGMKRRWLLLMVLVESLFLALVSALAGALVGIGLVRGVWRDGFDLSTSLPDGFDWAGVVIEPVLAFHLEAMQVVEGCLLVVVVTLLAALIPSWRVVRLRPAEVMR